MKTLIKFIILFTLGIAECWAQPSPVQVQEATAAQVTAGTVGWPYYVSPRRLAGASISPSGTAGGILGGSYPNPTFGSFTSATLGTALSDETGTGVSVFNNTPVFVTGLGFGAAPSTAPNSFGTLVYMTRTTAPATSTVGMLDYHYYALTPVDNTTVQTSLLGDIQINGSGSSGTGHSIGGIFRATDTSSNTGGQFSGLEGKRVALSNTNNGAAIFAVGDYNSASSMSGVVNQGLNFLMEHFNGTTATPVAAGEMDLITAQTPIGGDTTKMYGIKLGSNWQIRTGGAIASYDTATGATKNISISENGTDGLIQTSSGNIYLNPAGTITAVVGSFLPFNTGSALGGASNLWVLTGSVVGTTTNDNAAAGSVGELITATKSTASPVSLSTGTAANIISIILTAGDWEVQGTSYFAPNATTNVTRSRVGINTTTGTLPTEDSGALAYGDSFGVPGVQGFSVSTICVRESLTTTTTIYFVAEAAFTVDVLTVAGTLRARRVR